MAKRLHQTDDGPFGRRVWRAIAISQPAGDGTHRDQAGTGPGLLQQRNSATGEVELAVQVDCNGPIPVSGVDLFDRIGRACDAGIVDEYIEPAHGYEYIIDGEIDFGGYRYIRHAGCDTGVRRSEGIDGRPVDIADMDARTGVMECALLWRRRYLMPRQ